MVMSTARLLCTPNTREAHVHTLWQKCVCLCVCVIRSIFSVCREIIAKCDRVVGEWVKMCFRTAFSVDLAMAIRLEAGM